MKVTIDEQSSTRRGMEVEIPEEVVEREMTRAFEDYRRSARLPGFRRGKLPLSLVRQRFAKQVEGEVVSHLIEEYSHRALEERNLRPLHHPVLDQYDYRPGHPLVFRATFEVRPMLEVRDYLGLPVVRPEVEVTPDQVRESLESLRERAARYVPLADRKAAEGDVVVGTLAGRFQAGRGKDFTGEALTMTVGAEKNHPEFNQNLVGIGAGEARTFVVEYPSDYPSGLLAGRRVEYTLSAREIKVKELPALDDDLAREIGEFPSLAALEEHVRGELIRRSRAAADAAAKDNILTQLVEKNDFEVPESLVEAQLDRQVEDTVRLLLVQGIDPQHAEVNWKEEREKGRPVAVRRVRAMLILEDIAARESIQVTPDEINERIQGEARRQNMGVAEFKEQMRRKGHLEPLERQLLREKALDFLLDRATISREG